MVLRKCDYFEAIQYNRGHLSSNYIFAGLIIPTGVRVTLINILAVGESFETIWTFGGAIFQAKKTAIDIMTKKAVATRNIFTFVDIFTNSFIEFKARIAIKCRSKPDAFVVIRFILLSQNVFIICVGGTYFLISDNY